MASKELVIELLTRAREIFRERGGAKGHFEDESGRVCALGALRTAAGLPNIDLALAPTARVGDEYLVAIEHSLEPTAKRLHGNGNVASVNDTAEDPKSVILSLYDHAIKDLENVPGQH